MHRILEGKIAYLLLPGVLGLALYLRCIGITNPWGGHWDGWGGAYYSNVARNYLKYGYTTTYLLPVLNAGEVTPEDFIFYTHHPPLVGILVSLSFRVFGITEWAARLVPLVFSMLSVLLLFYIGRRTGGAGLGLLAALLLGIMPRSALYGTHVDPQGQLVILSTLLVLYGYLLYPDENRPFLSTALMAFGFLLGALADWPAFYIFGLLFVHRYLIRKRRDWRIVLFCAACAAVFILYHLYLHIALKEKVAQSTGLLDTAMIRIWGKKTEPMGKMLSDFFTNAYTFLGLPFLLLSFLWILLALLPDRFRPGALPGRLPAVLLLGVGFIHVAVFPYGAAVHEYWFVYLAPGLCLAGASAVLTILRMAPSRFTDAGRVLVLLGLAALAVHAQRHVSFSRDQWNTDYFLKLGADIQERTPSDSVVLVLQNAPPPLKFYADRDVFPFLPQEIPLLYTHLEGQTRAAFLVVFLQNKEMLWKVYGRYMEMMKARGVDTDVPVVDGFAVFSLTPERTGAFKIQDR